MLSDASPPDFPRRRSEGTTEPESAPGFRFITAINLGYRRERLYDQQIMEGIKSKGVRERRAAVSDVRIHLRVVRSVIENSAAPFY